MKILTILGTRPEIVRLSRIVEKLDRPVIISTHPRTRHKLHAFGLAADHPGVRFLEPFGFFDFITLEQRAMCVLSDGGTVQEECAIFGVPNVTIRDVTERPETIECGSNILSGADVESVRQCVRAALSLHGTWTPRANIWSRTSVTP